jgi:hypothetical protein
MRPAPLAIALLPRMRPPATTPASSNCVNCSKLGICRQFLGHYMRVSDRRWRRSLICDGRRVGMSLKSGLVNDLIQA